MKKLILILTVLCITFAYSFAQIPTTSTMNDFIDNLDNSAVKRATAGEFSTDTDNLNAKDVFDLNRTIFSAGYVPGFNSSSSSAVQAFLGVPILNNAMYFGIAGVYSMREMRTDYNPYIPTSPNGITLGKETTTGSTFAIRPVFKINDMISVHYLIARGNDKTVAEGYTSFTDDKNFTAITNTLGTSQWVHEIAVGLVFGEMKLKVPVRLTINDAGNSYTKGYTLTKTDTPNVSSYESQSGYTNTGNNTMNLSIAPEFYMPLAAGPMTGLNFGLTLGFDIYGMGEKIDNYSTEKTTYVDPNTPAEEYKSSTVTTQEGVFNMNVDINAYPTLEWSLADNRVRLVMEPTIGLAINVTNAGNVKSVYKSENTTSSNPATESTTTSVDKNSLVVTTPYVELPFGTAFRPVDWFEFRAGVSYRLGFAMTSGSTEALTGGKYKSFSYAFKSTMNLYTGMGFIVGEDFFIDLFLAAGTPESASTDLLNINSWGAQLSYRL